MNKQQMSLSNLVNGRLDQEFIDNMKEVLKYLKPGETGKIVISVSVKRPDDTNVIEVKADQKIGLPGRGLVCAGFFDGDKLHVEVSPAEANQEPLGFEGQEETEPEIIYQAN